MGIEEKYRMASSRTRDNKSIILKVSEEILRHYNCCGCHKWFSIADSLHNPTHCSNCGKRVKEIIEDKV